MDLMIVQALILTLCLGASAAFFFISTYRRRNNTEAKKRLPRAAGALPLIGHLHHFRKSDLLHKKLASMADQYGPAFTVGLGSVETLVVSDVGLAKELFTTLDKVFCDRPKITSTKILGYNYAMFGLAPYSPYWREIRRIATLELLSHRRIDLLRNLRGAEVDSFLKEVYGKWAGLGRPEGGAVVGINDLFGKLMLNSAVKMVGGRWQRGGEDGDEEESKRQHRVIRDFTNYLGLFVVSDAIPLLGWIDHLLGHKEKMKRTAEELDGLIEGWLEEHKQRKEKGKVEEERDFMDVMLDALKDLKSQDYDRDTVNKATCLNVILGASDTSTVTLTWALSLLQAVIKETLRLYPPSTLLSLRSAMEDCTLSTGHHVPKGTRLIVNVWKIHHDPNVWPEPEEFRPERFLTTHKDIDVWGQNHELIPFGSGRRSCPGIALGLRTIHFTMASLLHCYEFAKPDGKEIDMTESLGLINQKVMPLEVCVRPRPHAAEVYGF